MAKKDQNEQTENENENENENINDNSDDDANLPSNERVGNYFESYGAQAAQRNIIGDLLRFNKGDYMYGQNDELLDEGTQCIVDMNTLTVGWQKWEDKKPADADMGFVNQNFQPKRRKELGDLDENEWEVDENGRPRDPWQFTNMVVMRQIGTTSEEEGLYTFAGSSRGVINAIGTLCKIYGKKVRQDPEALPIVELNVDSYMHSNKSYGRIKIPVLDIVGWGTSADVEDATETVIATTDEAVDGETGEVTDRPRTAPRPAPRAAPRAETTRASASKKAVPKKTEAAKGKKKTRF